MNAAFSLDYLPYNITHILNTFTMLHLRYLKCWPVLALLFTGINASPQGVTTPRTPSPAASVTQTIGISTVNVNYSRPAVKGREIWGKLVPYGWNVQGFGAG